MLTSFSAIVCLALAICAHQIAPPAFDIGLVALQLEQSGFSFQPLVHQLLQIGDLLLDQGEAPRGCSLLSGVAADLLV